MTLSASGVRAIASASGRRWSSKRWVTRASVGTAPADDQLQRRARVGGARRVAGLEGDLTEEQVVAVEGRRSPGRRSANSWIVPPFATVAWARSQAEGAPVHRTTTVGRAPSSASRTGPVSASTAAIPRRSAKARRPGSGSATSTSAPAARPASAWSRPIWPPPTTSNREPTPDAGPPLSAHDAREGLDCGRGRVADVVGNLEDVERGVLCGDQDQLAEPAGPDPRRAERLAERLVTPTA